MDRNSTTPTKLPYKPFRIAKARGYIVPDAWIDGFNYVLIYGESSKDDDNPFLSHGDEAFLHNAYKAGAKAAESYLKHAKIATTEWPRVFPEHMQVSHA